MFPPVFLLNYDARLPWQVAPLIWLIGVMLLGTTRLTHRLYPRFGRGYYLYSAIARPLGIILIGWGWAEVLAPRQFHFLLSEWTIRVVIGLIILILAGALILRKFFIPLIAAGAFAFLMILSTIIFPVGQYFLIPFFGGAFCYSLWAIYKLRVRPSLFYSRIDDPLVTSGPYGLVRHPQLLASIIMAFSASLYLSPSRFIYHHAFAFFNAFPFSLSLWLIILMEEKDLKQKFGPAYLEYIKNTPRLFPALSKRLALHFAVLLLPIIIFIIGTIAILIKYDRDRGIQGKKEPWFIITSPYGFRLAVSEAKTNLGRFYTHQIQYYNEHGHYSSSMEGFYWDAEDDFQKERIYSYCMGTAFFSEANARWRYSSEEMATMRAYAEKLCARCSGVSATSFTVLAIGNVDKDANFDVWSTNDSKELRNVFNDMGDNGTWVPTENINCE
jgi:protein-S-isoprenylcysteine O-methyltransferase Ste14